MTQRRDEEIRTLRKSGRLDEAFELAQQSLEEAVDMMATYQVGVNLTHDQINLITNYLNALTGEYKGELLVNANDE